ncbi:MAG: hypothetical protein OEZ06_25670 [Myxococcales bacterium]|nr:hypothetical protein [Myxococcales bacterium]
MVLWTTEVKAVPPNSANDKLLAILACPKCHGSLKSIDEPEGFACESCGLLYGVDDGLPNMLIDDARPWPEGGAEASS